VNPGAETGAYCREIEAYLCRKNGGHLIRIVGPAFEKVNAWHGAGVPLKIVFRGIDRYVDRRTQQATRQRAVRVEFCEPDILRTFDAWKRAVGVLSHTVESSPAPEAEDDREPPRRPSLPAHLERVQTRLTSVAAGRHLPDALRRCIDSSMQQLDRWHDAARGVRGEARQRVLDGLREADREMLDVAWAAQDAETVAQLRDEAAAELASFRQRMTDETWRSSVESAARNLLRERLALPTLMLE
jgi:hypothetical protein